MVHHILNFAFVGSLSFDLDFHALLVSLAILALCYYLGDLKHRFAEPYFYYSDAKVLEGKVDFKRQGGLSRKLAWISLILFLLAFLNARVFMERRGSTGDENSVTPVEGIAIYLILDQSGSMSEVVFGKKGPSTKFELLKEVTRQFVTGRPNDLIGLVVFARAAHVLSPLTLDHASILSELSTFAPVKGTDNDGTSIGYAIFKTANLIAATKHYAEELKDKGAPAYTIKSTVMILITDGMQDPNPLDKGKRLRNMDIPEAAAYAKKQGIRLYTINVDPQMATEEFAAYHHIMQRASELTGGKFYMVDNATNLEDIYQEINALEKSAIPGEQEISDKDHRPDLYKRLSFYPYLIAAGLFFLIASVFVEAFLFRRIP